MVRARVMMAPLDLGGVEVSSFESGIVEVV